MGDLVESMREIARRLEFKPSHVLRGDGSLDVAASALREAADELTALRGDVALWKREAADRSEGMVQLNLDRAAMGVENMQLREALEALWSDVHGSSLRLSATPETIAMVRAILSHPQPTSLQKMQRTPAHLLNPESDNGNV